MSGTWGHTWISLPCDVSPLADFITPRSIRDANMALTDSVDKVLVDSSWVWPNELHGTLSELRNDRWSGQIVSGSLNASQSMLLTVDANNCFWAADYSKNELKLSIYFAAGRKDGIHPTIGANILEIDVFCEIPCFKGRANLIEHESAIGKAIVVTATIVTEYDVVQLETRVSTTVELNSDFLQLANLH
ncbi:hypothetical protein QVD17_38141 [Tagetes erecta]|uniref:Uncharacterized protein n=1 Tax=Tagetes erecta TaxID=13708 RepID=A0AAD8NKN0_TARER|nr:hypothetical protein QVD17_38141 [Tagetes erecta]